MHRRICTNFLDLTQILYISGNTYVYSKNPLPPSPLPPPPPPVPPQFQEICSSYLSFPLTFNDIILAPGYGKEYAKKLLSNLFVYTQDGEHGEFFDLKKLTSDGRWSGKYKFTSTDDSVPFRPTGISNGH